MQDMSDNRSLLKRTIKECYNTVRAFARLKGFDEKWLAKILADENQPLSSNLQKIEDALDDDAWEYYNEQREARRHIRKRRERELENCALIAV